MAEKVKMRTRPRIVETYGKKILGLLILIAFGVLNLAPIFWGLVTSLKEQKVIASYPPKIFGFTISFEHYARIFTSGYLRAIMNSFIYSICAIILGVLVGYLAAYGFERIQFRCKKALFYVVVAGIPLSVGSSILLVPNYLYMMQFKMTDKWFTLILLYAAYNLPMAIWLLIAGIKTIPIEIEEAATVDGCSKFYIISRMLPPLLKPSIAAACLFIFIGAWNEYITASVMVNSAHLKTIQMAIYDYLGYFGQEWGPLTAAATIAVLPILLVFTFLGKMLVSGLTAGAVKG